MAEISYINDFGEETTARYIALNKSPSVNSVCPYMFKNFYMGSFTREQLEQLKAENRLNYIKEISYSYFKYILLSCNK